MRACLVGIGFVFLSSCNKASSDAPAPVPPPAISSAAPTSSSASPSVLLRAEVGKPAPDFTLSDLDGKPVSLHDFKGKTVVLEWFNPGCPFVKAAHMKGSLVGAAAKHTAKGVVWLAINSGAEGKQGFGVPANKEGAAKFSMAHPILMDTTGATGHAYGATNTPGMYVIDGAGVLRYMGAIDNSPDAEGESPTGPKLINYVDEAVAAIAASKEVETKQTKQYGCSVKY